ncbi:MAG: glutamate ABC transporter substrate-binding protein [Stackebrandtia sp.]
MRMLRRTAITCLAVAGLALSGCAGAASEKQEEEDALKEEVGDYSMEQAAEIPDGLIKEIQERGKLVVGTKYDQPLIGQKDTATGDIKGFDAEMGRLLAMRIFGEVDEGEGGNLEFVETTSENRETYIDDNTVDVVIASYSIYPDRIESYDFAGPYIVTGQNVMVAADNTDINSVDDLSGKDVCIAEGSGSIANMEKENPEAKVNPLKDYSACAEAVKTGNADAVSTDSTILYGFIAGDPEAFRVLEDSNIFTEENYGIAMKLGETDARNFVNDMIEESIDNGDWDKAFELTFGAADMPKPDYPTVDRYEAK